MQCCLNEVKKFEGDFDEKTLLFGSKLHKNLGTFSGGSLYRYLRGQRIAGQNNMWKGLMKRRQDHHESDSFSPARNIRVRFWITNTYSSSWQVTLVAKVLLELGSHRGRRRTYRSVQSRSIVACSMTSC